MYNLLDTIYILFETFFVYVKMGELFEVEELDGTDCTLNLPHHSANMYINDVSHDITNGNIMARSIV
jgi:hypothetical protein